MEINKLLQQLLKDDNFVSLNGESLGTEQMSQILSREVSISVSSKKSIRERVLTSSKHVSSQIKEGVPIYGVNTAFGGHASLVLNSGTPEERISLAKQISQATVHVDVSTGPAVPKNITKLALSIRANMLLRGVSGVTLDLIEAILELVNKDAIPVVGSFGGLGASGDLPQNGRVVSLLANPTHVKCWGENGGTVEAVTVLNKKKIKQFDLGPKEGLALINGDNFSTASAFHLTSETLFLFSTQLTISALMHEALLGTNRSLHPMISKVRPHPGQKETSDQVRHLLTGSKYIRDELKELLPRVEGRKVQDVYSIRCVPQFLGPDLEKILRSFSVVERNANSVSDNPLWVSDEYATEGEIPWQWVSGGNFLAMYMVDVMDDLRKVITHTVKLNDRYLSRLIDPHENNGLPANLSSSKALSQCVFKGVQAQAGMLDVYSTFLANPISTLFGVHEQNNQDVTSHAMTSGIIGRQNLELAWIAQAQLLLSIAQAVDLREGPEKLAPRTKQIYEFVRKHADFVEKETSLAFAIEILSQKIQTKEFRSVVAKVLSE